MATKRQRKRRIRQKKNQFKAEYQAGLEEGLVLQDGYNPLKINKYKADGTKRGSIGILKSRKKRQKGLATHLEAPLVTKEELAKAENKAVRKQNKEMHADNQTANKLAKNRYGVEGIRKNTTQEGREKAIMTQNNRLKIAPALVDKGRKGGKVNKALAGAFLAIDELANNTTDRIEGEALRGELFRVSELGEAAGTKEGKRLAKKADYYLTRFDNTKITQLAGVTRAVGTLRDMQMLIQNMVNVDFLDRTHDLDRFDDAALYGGLTVNAMGTELIFGHTFEQAVESHNNRKQDTLDRMDSDYEPGSRKHGNSWLDEQNALIDSMEMPTADQFATGEDDIPWWAR